MLASLVGWIAMRTEQLLLVWCFLPLCFAEPVFIAYRITQVWKSTSICSLVSTQNRLFNSENREYISENRVFVCCFPLGGFVRTGFVRTNREKSNLTGWRQTLTTSPPNHIRFLLVRAEKTPSGKRALIR